MRKLAFVTIVIALMIAITPQSASAGDQWCESDPLVVVKTPAGSNVSLFVTNGAKGLEHLPALELATIGYSVNAAGGGTVVRMTVLVPDDAFENHFETRTTVSTGPLKTGTVLATAQGFSGQSMHMEFKLDVP